MNYTPVTYNGKASEPIFAEILFQNKTVADSYVAFDEKVKYNTIFTEANNVATSQAYISGEPTAAGSVGAKDVLVTPDKVMYYAEFAPESLRPSRFSADMKAGAWNTISDKFEQSVLLQYSRNISADAENNFWSGVKEATKVTIAAGGASTEEKALIAGLPTKFVDGVVATLVSAERNISVVGTTITSATIKAEYEKLYLAIPAESINNSEKPVIYAPMAHLQLINSANINATTRDIFAIVDGVYFYNSTEIRFVQLPADTMIAAIPSQIVWCTDLLSDETYLKIETIAANRDDMFVKAVYTLGAHVANQEQVVLYS
jgi:hypothetical protein